MSRSDPLLRAHLGSVEFGPSATTSRTASRVGNAGYRRRHVTACAVALGTAWAVTSAMPSRGHILKADLQAAGATIRDLGLNQPVSHVKKAVAGLFPGYAVDVDASRFPGRVVVTLRALDQVTCQTALAEAQRIQGKVVIELRGFASPSECGEHNDMAWAILP